MSGIGRRCCEPRTIVYQNEVTWNSWPCSPSAPDVGTAKCAVCAGSGKWRFRNSARLSSLFLVRGVKNGDERLVVLNRIARSVIEQSRGTHPTFCSPTMGIRSAACSLRDGPVLAIALICPRAGACEQEVSFEDRCSEEQFS